MRGGRRGLVRWGWFLRTKKRVENRERKKKDNAEAQRALS
jgi:hypothetical protein